MKYRLLIFSLLLKVIVIANDISFNGQFFTTVNNVNKNSFIDFGYMPKTHYSYNINEELIFDFEYAFYLRENYNSNIKLKSNPYRYWIRFSDNALDVRIGLQKIAFGSALFLRPLSWFDSLDFRYTTGQTDGVESARFIFSPSNYLAIWFWIIENDFSGQSYGSRIELSTIGLLKGDWGFTYYRDTESNPHFPYPVLLNQLVTDGVAGGFGSSVGFSENNRFGLDYRYDGDFGFWLESCYNDFGKYGDLSLLTLGADYTFPILNGLLVSSETMLSKYSFRSYLDMSNQLAFSFSDVEQYSILHLSIPVDHINNFSLYSILDWNKNITDNLLRWSSVYNSFSIDYMFTLKTGKLNDIFQLVFVYNY